MANRTIIVEYEFKSENAEQRLAAMRAAMADLKKEQAELDKQRKAGVITMEQYTAKSAENAATQRSLKIDIDGVNRSLNAEAKAQKASTEAKEAGTGSLNEMRAELSKLKAEYGNLSKAERESARGKELQAKTKALNDDIKELEQGYGVYSRNVGNYTESVMDALGRSFPLFDQAQGYIDALKASAELLAQGYTMFGNAMDIAAAKTTNLAATEATAAAAGEANAVAQTESAGATAAAGGAANIATKSFARLNVVLLMNPFTLIAVAIVGLIAYMTQFSGVLDGLEQMWSGLVAASKPVISMFGAVGKVIFDVVKTVGTGISAIVSGLTKVATGDFQGAKKAILDGFAEVKAGIADVGESIKDAQNQFKNLGSAMKEAYNAGSDLRRRMQDLEDAEALFALNRIDRENQAKKLELAAADRSRSAVARVRDLQTAGRIFQQLANEEAALAKRRYELQREELLSNRDLIKYRGLSNKQLVETMKSLEDAGKLQGDYAADIKTLADMYKVLTDAQEKAANVQLQTNAATGRLRAQIAAQQKQAIEDEIKLSNEQLAFEARKAGVYAEMAQDQQTRLELSKKAIDAEMELSLATAKSEEERVLIKQKANYDKLELDRKYQSDVLAEQERFNQSIADLENILFEEQLSRIREQNERRKTEIMNAGLSEYDAKQQSLDADLEMYREQLEVLQQAGKTTIDAENNIAQTRASIKNNAIKQDEMIMRAQISIARNVAGAIGQAGQMMASNQAQLGEFQKGMALFNIGISTAESIANVSKIASQSSTDPITFAVSLTGMIATVLANIAQASSILSSSSMPSAPSFERGGMIGGSAHYAGGTIIEAQRGEMILNTGAVRMAGPMLTALNAAGNGDMMAMTAINQQKAELSDRRLLDIIAAMPPQTVNVIDTDRVQTDGNRVINNNRLARV